MAVSTEELETTVQEVLGRLKSHQFFQSTWDTAAFIIFLTFVGTVLLLLLLVIAHCWCCSCCRSPGPRRASPRKVSPWKVSPAGLRDLHGTVLGVEEGGGGSGGKGAHPPREGANPLGPSVLLVQERPKGVDNLALEP
uniref:Small integral membrane protein 22 n=1 Tax=Rhinopithecus roxellana TaxID=61622 RepID=A0A2K6NZ49_RHIRO